MRYKSVEEMHMKRLREADPNARVLFYYIRDSRRRPVVTVCLVVVDGWRSRGMAICGFRDNPIKAVGRALAIRRATKAACSVGGSAEEVRASLYEKMAHVHPTTWKLLCCHLCNITPSAFQDLFGNSAYTPVSTAIPRLTPFEKLLLAPKKVEAVSGTHK